MSTSSQTIADQAPAFVALAALADAFGNLPSPYIVVHSSGPVSIGLQLRSPAAFEMWRVALQIAPNGVRLLTHEDAVWLAASTRLRGVSVDVTGFGMPVTTEQATAVQAVSA